MFQNIKLALTGRSDETILKSDARLHDADVVLQDLQRLLPKLEAALDENENLWASLGHNLTTTAGTLKSLFPATSTRMHVTLDALTSAGFHISKCRTHHPLSTESATCRAELRAFTAVVDELRATFAATVDAFRTRERYRAKVEVLVEAENANRRRQTDREVARRIRNEQKLNQVGREADVLAEKLQDQVDQTVIKKRVVVNTVVMKFLHFQHAHLAGDRMAPVIAAFSAVSTSSNMRQGHNQGSKSGFHSDSRYERSMIDPHFSWLDDDSDGSGGENNTFTQHAHRSFHDDGTRNEQVTNEAPNYRGAMRSSGIDASRTSQMPLGYPYVWNNDHDSRNVIAMGGRNTGMSRSNSRKVRFPDTNHETRRDDGSLPVNFTPGRRHSRKIHEAPDVEMELSEGQRGRNSYSPVGFSEAAFGGHPGRVDRTDSSDNTEIEQEAGSAGMGLYPRPC